MITPGTRLVPINASSFPVENALEWPSPHTGLRLLYSGMRKSDATASRAGHSISGQCPQGRYSTYHPSHSHLPYLHSRYRQSVIAISSCITASSLLAYCTTEKNSLQAPTHGAKKMKGFYCKLMFEPSYSPVTPSTVS